MRIALIAMSRTQSYDEELHSLGRATQGFAGRWDTIASLPSLALLTLAGMTPRSHTVDYFEVQNPDDFDISPGKYQLAGISTYSAQVLNAYALAERLRQAGVPVVIGGPHVSILADEAAQHVDSVVVGEGESVWLQVLDDAERGRLQPRYGNLDASFDLAQAPMPAYELLDLSRYNRLPLQSSRGCPHRCEFCASSVLLSGKYKMKPIERLLAELDAIRNLWSRPFIEFVNDNTFVNRKYWKQLLPELKKRRFRWFAEADLSIARDEELLKMMRDSGCVQVLVGFESPLQEDLNGLDTRGNWKMKQLPRARDAVNAIQSHGITVLGCFVVGMDTQGPGVFDAIYDFIVDTEMYDVQVTIETPFPGTPLYERLKRENRLLDDGNWAKCTLFDVTFQPKGMTIEELRRGFRDLGLRIFNDEFTAWRRERFKEKLRSLLRKSPVTQ